MPSLAVAAGQTAPRSPMKRKVAEMKSEKASRRDSKEEEKDYSDDDMDALLQEQANELKKRLDAAGLHGEIRKSKDLCRVLITGYKDRAAAIKALNDLKQRAGFEKAFVQNLSSI